jgi:hypothetical protein
VRAALPDGEGHSSVDCAVAEDVFAHRHVQRLGEFAAIALRCCRQTCAGSTCSPRVHTRSDVPFAGPEKPRDAKPRPRNAFEPCGLPRACAHPGLTKQRYLGAHRPDARSRDPLVAIDLDWLILQRLGSGRATGRALFQELSPSCTASSARRNISGSNTLPSAQKSKETNDAWKRKVRCQLRRGGPAGQHAGHRAVCVAEHAWLADQCLGPRCLLAGCPI